MVRTMVGTRRKARSLALQALYEVDAAKHEANLVIERLLGEEDLSPENADFTRELVIGVIDNKNKIDDTIRSFAPAWPIAQIPIVDRNIMRLAIFEILFDNKVPVEVAINEAVELAKTFGSDNSPRFVNGVLGSVSALANREKILERGVGSGDHF